MQILIVDDEPLARTRLHSLLDELGVAEQVGEAANGKQALEQVARQAPHVVLLDIRMPGMDGMETAQHLNKLDNPPAIIFTTAYDQYALDAFKSHAVDYLLKPIRKQQLHQALQAATRLSQAQLQSLQQMQQEQHHPSTHISARVHGNIQLIPLNEVLYFLAEHKYVTVRHLLGEVLIDDPLKSLEDQFQDQFLRIHRNALVARQYIQGLEKDRNGQHFIRLQHTEQKLEVSRRHLPDVRRYIKQLAGG